MILLIGGASCTGKSTLAREVAHRHNITNVISTDTIRCVLREALDQFPYESHLSWKQYTYEFDKDLLILEFKNQCKLISSYIDALVGEAKKYKKDTIIEGIHALPSLIQDPEVSKVIMDLQSFKNHWGRVKSRPEAQRYQKEFEGFRGLRDFIFDDARKSQTKVIQNTNKEQAIEELMEFVKK